MSEVRQGNVAVAPDSPLKKVVLASNNAGKLREFAALLGAAGIELIPQGELNVPEAEEPHPTFVENALTKARHAVCCSCRPSSSLMIFRIRYFWIFPVTVVGNASTKRMYLGTL